MNPTDFISAIRESHKLSNNIYQNGGCFKFFKILKEVYPEAKPYYNSDHVITKIGDKYYDIGGNVEKENHILMTIDEQEKANQWEWDYKQNLETMLNTSTLENLSKVLGITAEDLKAKITSEKEEEINLPTGQFFSEDDLSKRDSSKYNEGKEAGQEMLVKDLKKKYGYEFEGKDADAFLNHHNDQLKTKYSKNSNDRVIELENDLKKQKATFDNELNEIKNAKEQFENQLRSQRINNELLTLMPKETAIKKDAVITLFNNSHGIVEEDGKTFVTKNGEKLKDDKTMQPMALKDVFDRWVFEEGYAKKPNGRGGGNETGGNGNSVAKLTPTEFTEKWQRENPDSTTTGSEYQKAYAEYRKSQTETA